MIAILEDRKGFRKRVDLYRHLPYYTIAQWESWLSVPTGEMLHATPVKGTEITFDFIREEFDHESRTIVQLFRERI